MYYLASIRIALKRQRDVRNVRFERFEWSCRWFTISAMRTVRKTETEYFTASGNSVRLTKEQYEAGVLDEINAQSARQVAELEDGD